MERAKRAYEIATRSLFRDVSSYSFDSYRRELASDLTLDDLQAFTERFLARHRRQLQRKESFLEFLTPDVLRTPELPERVRNATFDRELAIQRPDAEFLALGHPFVDAMLQYAGSYDFGGLTAVRHITEPKLAGRSGFLFVFVVRQRITPRGRRRMPVPVRAGVRDGRRPDRRRCGVARGDGRRRRGGAADRTGSRTPAPPSTSPAAGWKKRPASGIGRMTSSFSD